METPRRRQQQRPQGADHFYTPASPISDICSGIERRLRTSIKKSSEHSSSSPSEGPRLIGPPGEKKAEVGGPSPRRPRLRRRDDWGGGGQQEGILFSGENSVTMIATAAHHQPLHPSAAEDGREATEEFLAERQQQRAASTSTASTSTATATVSTSTLGEDEASTAAAAAVGSRDTTSPAKGEPSSHQVSPSASPSTSALDRDEGRVSTPPPPEDEGSVSTPPPEGESGEAAGTDQNFTPSRPELSPLNFATPRTGGGVVEDGVGADNGDDLRGRVEELERTVAVLFDFIQAQQQQDGSEGGQVPLAPRTPLRSSLRPTASQLCLHPLDSPSPTPRSSKAIPRGRMCEQGAISMPDLDEDTSGNSTRIASGELRRSPIPEPTPDLEYRTYTTEYEEELKKIRAVRQRGMSFDMAEVVERNIQSETEAGAESDTDSPSSSGSSKGSSQSSLEPASKGPEGEGGEGGAESKDDATASAIDATLGKGPGLPPLAPRRNRSTGELKKLEEQPTTPTQTQSKKKVDSPKGVEEGPSQEIESKVSGPASTAALSAGEANSTKEAERQTPLEKKLSAIASTGSLQAPPSDSSQQPPKLAMKRTPVETAAVISASDQGKEKDECSEASKPKKEKNRGKRTSEKRSSERRTSESDKALLPAASSKATTPKSSLKKSTPQQSQKKAASSGEPAPQMGPPPVTSMFTYIKNDLLSNMNLDSKQQDGSASEDVDANMQEFIKVPSKLESLLFFGLAICTDSFLYVLAFLPLKFFWSCVCLLCTILRPGKGIRGCRFHRRHLYQILLTFVIWAVYQHVLVPISIGKLYHWIRGQAMIKLYVLIAMADVFDRLLCSLGQDSLDSLYWNTTRRPYHPRMVISTCVVLVYATLHTLILFVHIATLNVAMNSSDQALLTLLISGNFAEIKSTVFKKYNKQNLFKITTSDICERFKLILFLSLILLLNCFQGGMNRKMIEDYITVTTIVMAAEMICDWIKHSFITKFNFIKSSAYPDYALILAGDVTGVGHEGINLNHTHAVVKRLGFSQIPLVCVFARYIREALRYGMVMSGENGTGADHFFKGFAALYTDGNWTAIAAIVLGIFHCLLLMKIVLGYSVLKACRRLLDGPAPAKSDEILRPPAKKTKEMSAGESAKQEKSLAPRRQAV